MDYEDGVVGLRGGRLGTDRYIMHRTPQPTVYDILKYSVAARPKGTKKGRGTGGDQGGKGCEGGQSG